MREDPPKDLLDWLRFSNVPNWAVARPLGALFGFLIFVLFLMAFGAAFYTLLGVFIAPDRANLGTGALIVALMGAPFVVWRTMIAQRDLNFKKEGHITDRINKAVEQLGAEKTIKRPERDEDGKPKLVEGKPVVIEETVPNIEVRIGAILSLERIAQDSTAYDKGRDHVRVMEILCAYIRENAPGASAQNHPDGDWEPLADDATDEQYEAHEKKRKARFKEGSRWTDTIKPPREDVALALKVIGRRTLAQRLVEANWPEAGPAAEWVFDVPAPQLPDIDSPNEEAVLRAFLVDLDKWKERLSRYKGYRHDLSGTNLQKADLSGCYLSGIRFANVRLEGAYLDSARIEGVSLDGARLEGGSLRGARLDAASLFSARLEGASLYDACLEGAYLDSARLEGASLVRAHLARACFSHARLEGVSLSDARLEGASLSYARLEGAYLHGANLASANLFGARLEGAYFGGASLGGAYLTNTRLDGATFASADLDGASLFDARLDVSSLIDVDLSTCSGLNQEQIEAAFGWADVILPQDLVRPLHWPGPHVKDPWEEYEKWLSDPAGYVPPPPPEPEEGDAAATSA